MKKILILGARGYLGRPLGDYLEKNPDNVVYRIDKNLTDLRDYDQCLRLFKHIDCDEIYQLAADSGNMQYLLSEDYTYGDSSVINLTIIKALRTLNYKGKVLFPSSFYAADTNNRYGLEKYFNETLYLASGLDVRIPRLFSVYGPGERLDSVGEKVTTAFCRKVIEKKNKGTIKIKGCSETARYFLHIDDAISGLVAHMNSDIIECDLAGKKNISLGQLLHTVIEISGKDIKISWSDVIGDRWEPHSNNLEWEPRIKFEYGIGRLYKWVENELR